MSWQIPLRNWLWYNVAWQRDPDVVIGGSDHPYLYRWHVIPRNPIFNIYLHEFLRSDDDRALHDHPWVNMSILLDGEYYEHVPNEGGVPRFYKNDVEAAAYGYTSIKYRRPGYVYFRKPSQLHRVELKKNILGNEIPVWTLFVTGPRIRQWGFACKKGWIHWKDFTGEDSAGSSIVGNGCGDD